MHAHLSACCYARVIPSRVKYVPIAEAGAVCSLQQAENAASVDTGNSQRALREMMQRAPQKQAKTALFSLHIGLVRCIACGACNLPRFHIGAFVCADVLLPPTVRLKVSDIIDAAFRPFEAACVKAEQNMLCRKDKNGKKVKDPIAEVDHVRVPTHAASVPHPRTYCEPAPLDLIENETLYSRFLTERRPEKKRTVATKYMGFALIRTPLSWCSYSQNSWHMGLKSTRFEPSGLPSKRLAACPTMTWTDCASWENWARTARLSTTLSTLVFPPGQLHATMCSPFTCAATPR